MTRALRGLRSDATIEPIAPGMYSVGPEGDTYIIDLRGYTQEGVRAICECSDFRYRCVDQNIDCKHIHAVKHRISQGLLPPADEDPREWLRSRLDSIQRRIGLADTEAPATQQLIEEMRQTPFTVEYKDIVELLSDELEDHRL